MTYKSPKSHFLELKIPPVILVLLFAGLMWALSITLPVFDVNLPYNANVAGLFVVIGVYSAIAGVIEFHKAHTTVDPRVPNQTTTLVQSGIYRISRNPMYLGFANLLIAVALWLSNGAAMALVFVFVLYMNRFQIIPEERFISDKFGDAYTAYTRKVRRWL